MLKRSWRLEQRRGFCAGIFTSVLASVAGAQNTPEPVEETGALEEVVVTGAG